MPLSAQEAAADIAERNFHRTDVPSIPDMIRQTGEENKIYIFNVGPKRWMQEMGGRGIFNIPECPEGAEFSQPIHILGLYPETIPVDMKKLEIRYEDGMLVAKDIVGLGVGKRAENSLIPWGVFLSKRNPPSKAELAAANKALDEQAARLVQQADDYHNAGPQQYVNITGDHRWALNRTRQVRAWGQPIAKMDECPGCKESIKPGVVRHTCGAILDIDKAVELGLITAEQAASMKKPSAKA